VDLGDEEIWAACALLTGWVCWRRLGPCHDYRFDLDVVAGHDLFFCPKGQERCWANFAYADLKKARDRFEFVPGAGAVRLFRRD